MDQKPIPCPIVEAIKGSGILDLKWRPVMVLQYHGIVVEGFGIAEHIFCKVYEKLEVAEAVGQELVKSTDGVTLRVNFIPLSHEFLLVSTHQTALQASEGQGARYIHRDDPDAYAETDAGTRITASQILPQDAPKAQPDVYVLEETVEMARADGELDGKAARSIRFWLVSCYEDGATIRENLLKIQKLVDESLG